METNHFRVIRETLGFSGIFLINYLDCGYEQTLYSAIEVGKAHASRILIEELCETYHINPMWFGDDSEEILVDHKRVRPSKSDVLDRLEKEKNEQQTPYASIIKRAGVERTVLYRSSNLSISSIEKLAQALNVGFEWLLWGEEKAHYYPVNDTLII